MDVDTHGETGGTAREGRRPRAFKRSSNLSHRPPRLPLPLSLPSRPPIHKFPNAHCCLVSTLSSHSTHPCPPRDDHSLVESPCERVYARVDPGPCAQNRRTLLFPPATEYRTPDQIYQKCFPAKIGLSHDLDFPTLSHLLRHPGGQLKKNLGQENKTYAPTCPEYDHYPAFRHSAFRQSKDRSHSL